MKKLCLNLVKCDKEDDVIKLLQKEGLWDDPSAWRYYGDSENNFATIGNQQSLPESAIVEKIINSVDAVLMSECLSKGINPESKEAPQSIRDALVEYFNIYDGKLSNIDTQTRKKLSENICLVATGSKTNPCYSIIDKGEGQAPKKMSDTLLSIDRSNKLRIPFVQGKFNMGGTGVFRFCGLRNLQLVISRRNPKIVRHEIKDHTEDYWGFTIIRREDPHSGIRSSTYRYLAPNNNILTFKEDGLLLIPGPYPKSYYEILEWGTFIKLYEYQMAGLKTNILFDLYNRLSLLVPNIALPVRFYERRKGYTAHTFEATLSGLSVRLEEDKRENIEEGFPSSSNLVALGQKMKVLIYVFKRGQSEKYSKNEGIIFTVNGQSHAFLSRSFFSRRNVGMGYLADSILVIVDCTEIDGRSREDLFMNSRDRLSSGNLRSEIERNLEELLLNHKGLRDLRERRRREEIENKLQDSKPLADVIEDILKRSPTLSKLFIDGVRLPNPFKLTFTGEKPKYLGKRFPTFFKLKVDFPEENPKNCPINIRFRVQFETDADNEYFNRDSDPGTFLLFAEDHIITDYILNLWNGIANLTVTLPSGVKVGDKIHFRSIVEDVSVIEQFENSFVVVVDRIADKGGGTPGKRQPPSGKEPGIDREKPSYLDLPNIIEVRRDNWELHSFDRDSALKAVDNGEEGYDFFVNMDNICLQMELKTFDLLEPKLLEARYKYGMVLVGIALLKDYESSHQEKDNDNNGESVFDKIQYVTRVISPILLPMISSLGELELREEKTIVYQNIGECDSA